jgi:hypothetical protein
VQVLQVIKGAGIDNPAFGLFQENAKAPLGRAGLTGATVRAIVKDQFHRSLFGTGGFWWEDKLAAVSGFEAEIRGTTLGQIFSKAFGGGSVWGGNNFLV